MIPTSDGSRARALFGSMESEGARVLLCEAISAATMCAARLAMNAALLAAPAESEEAIRKAVQDQLDAIVWTGLDVAAVLLHPEKEKAK